MRRRNSDDKNEGKTSTDDADSKYDKPRQARQRKFQCLFIAFITIAILGCLRLVRGGKDDGTITRKTTAEWQEPPQQAEEDELPIEDTDDEMNGVDFSAGGVEDLAYRIGDAFVTWYLQYWPWQQLVHVYSAYPNTVANLYLAETGHPKYANRNITALLKVLDHKAEQGVHFRKARKNELVVHIRMGDVLTHPEYIDTSVSMRDLWNANEGWLSIDDDVKYNYNRAEYEELLERIPPRVAKNIKNCVIVGARHLSHKIHDSRNDEYRVLVESTLREKIGCDVSYYTASNPDKDLMFMASAYWFIGGMGGFAQIAAACVTARRGWGHAIYDFFNGEVASYNDRRLSPRQQTIHRNEYIDWSTVNMKKTRVEL